MEVAVPWFRALHIYLIGLHLAGGSVTSLSVGQKCKMYQHFRPNGGPKDPDTLLTYGYQDIARPVYMTRRAILGAKCH